MYFVYSCIQLIKNIKKVMNNNIKWGFDYYLPLVIVNGTIKNSLLIQLKQQFKQLIIVALCRTL